MLVRQLLLYIAIKNMTLTTTDYCSLFAGFTGSEWLGMTNLEQG
jgi:ABC-type polysaccharide transport system permease subunit